MMRKILEKEIVLSGEACPETMGWIPSWMYQAVVSNGALVGDEARGEDELQRAEELQEERDADGGDEGGDARGVAQGLVGHPLDGDREQRCRPPWRGG